MSSDLRPILVGIDGSPVTSLAVGWAAREAASRHVPLRLVCATGRGTAYESLRLYGDLPDPELGAAREAARGYLAAAAQQVLDAGHRIEVDTKIVEGDAAHVLLTEADQASAVVLGSRGLAGLGSLALGSVGVAVSARASCPVIVLRAPAGPAEERTGVVVGVDASETCESALGYAFDFADRHSLPLRAVLCWHPDLLAQMMWRSEPPPPQRAQTWLSEALAGWRERYPDVETHASVIREHPADGLVATAATAQLLVVGTRGRHALTGTLLGSVSQGVLHRATCPVAVVPPVVD